MTAAAKRGPVLYVDDQGSSVKLFQLHFAEEFDLEGFTSPTRAIARAKERNFALLVADYRMVEMDGLELARHFQVHHPRTIRVLYTALDHLDVVDQALKSGLIAQVITKPVSLDDVAVRLKALLETAS
ncbi:MAG: response regulator [Deltaproteobacteria bacterium]|nr:response regulator [Deltaproteobacteria bacterium]